MVGNICGVQGLIDSSLANIKILGTQAIMSIGRTELSNNSIVPFNSIIVNQNPSVSLDTATGVFTVLKGGNYIVHYYVNINGSDQDTTVTLECNGVKNEAFRSAEGQSSGFAALTLSAGDTISLKNVSEQIIVLFGDEIQAGIMIYTV